MSWARALLPLALALGGCGLQPLYRGGGAGPVAQTLAGVEVAPIAGRNGWLLHNALVDRLPKSDGQARFRLLVDLDDRIEGFGVRTDEAVTRERRTLRTRYQLIDATTGETLLDAAAGSDAGIDVVGSEYATVAAENSAAERLVESVADQMVGRVALYVKRTGAK